MNYPLTLAQHALGVLSSQERGTWVGWVKGCSKNEINCNQIDFYRDQQTPHPAPGGGTKCTRSITVVNGGYNRCIYIKGWVNLSLKHLLWLAKRNLVYSSHPGWWSGWFWDFGQIRLMFVQHPLICVLHGSVHQLQLLILPYDSRSLQWNHQWFADDGSANHLTDMLLSIVLYI